VVCLRKGFSSHITAVVFAVVATGSAVHAQPADQHKSDKQAPAASRIDPQILHAQVLLDRAGFSPGVITGKGNASYTKALRGYQQARNIPVTGKLDAATSRSLMRDRSPATVKLAVGEGDVKGPFYPDLPESSAGQAKAKYLGYRNALEMLAEKFHTTPETITALNPPGTRVAAGTRLVFPNILPQSRNYDASLKPEWRGMLNTLNVNATQPVAARVEVSKSAGVLRVFDKADHLVAQFPATMGSSHDPLPIGNWTIKGRSFLPSFNYNPELFWDVSDKKPKLTLPPGPNGPVGVVWIDLSKEHYGIHGTPDPETIGTAKSHGCVRLTNWDAARLAQMVTPGTKAEFRK